MYALRAYFLIEAEAAKLFDFPANIYLATICYDMSLFTAKSLLMNNLRISGISRHDSCMLFK